MSENLSIFVNVFSPDIKYMLSTAFDCKIRLSHYPTGEPTPCEEIFHGTLNDLGDALLAVATLRGALKQATEQLLELQAEKEWTPSRA